MRSLFVFLTLLTLSASTVFFLPTASVEAGIIPCGLSTPDPDIPGGGTERCTLCHLIVGINQIIIYLRNILSAIAIAVIVAMAFVYLTSGGNESRMTFAKGGMIAALIGLCIVLLAWVTVNFILTLPIFNTSTNLIRTGWNTVQCQTSSLSAGATTPMVPGGGGGNAGGGAGGGGDTSAVTLPRDDSGNVIVTPLLPSPTGLSVTVPTTTTTLITWNAIPEATGYELERCIGQTCTLFTPLVTLTGTSFTDTGLSSGTDYTYHVRAITPTGVSNWSNAVGVMTPGTPGNPYVYTPPPDNPYGWNGGGNDGSGDPGGGGGTNSCSRGAPGDPGFGRGTWYPPGTTNHIVVDQMGPNGTGGFTAFPECVNQWNDLGSHMVAQCSSVGPGGFTMAQGHTMSIRFIAGTPTPGYTPFFRLQDGTGAGIPANVSISLSTRPGDFSSGPAACHRTAVAGSQPTIVLGDANCPVVPGSLYYYNVRTDSTCGGGTCRFMLWEPNNMQGTTVSCTAGSGTTSCSAGAPGDPRTGSWRPSANILVGDPTGGSVQSNVTYIPGCLNPDPNQTIQACGANASGASMTAGSIVSVRYRVGASYTQGQYYQFNSGGGSGISYPIDISLSLTPGDFSTPDTDCRTSGFQLSAPRIVIGDGAGQCHLQTNSLYYLNTRIRESCSGPSCVFKINEPLSLQGTTVSCSTSGSGSTPAP